MQGCCNAFRGHILDLMHLCPVPRDEQLGLGQHGRKTKIYTGLEMNTGQWSRPPHAVESPLRQKPDPPQLIHSQGFHMDGV